MQHQRDRRKIDPSRGPTLPDGSPNDNDRVEIGPTRLALGEWAEAGLEPPDLGAMRRHRWERLTAHVVERGWGGILLFDPLNIRYATDHSNMQLWNTHNPFRAVLLCADGHMVLWDYRNSPFLADHLPLVREVRSGASFFYFGAGDRTRAQAGAFAAEVRDLMAEHAGSNRRLGVDKIMAHGLRALEGLGLEVMEGEEAAERARAVKGADEIRAMRCAIHAGEASVAAMQEVCGRGVSEDEIWSVLHAENIRRGGEWIETRLLASGPRTNPWFQECGPRVVQPNEVVAFDTDLVGCYGMCVDISRTWWVGPGRPRPDMVSAMRHAREHVEGERLAPRPRRLDAGDHREGSPARARVPRPALRLHDPRGGAVRRVAGDRVPRGPRGGRLRPRARARHGTLRRGADGREGRRLLDQARGPGARHRDRGGEPDLLPLRCGAHGPLRLAQGFARARRP